jgi:hypothetical protein
MLFNDLVGRLADVIADKQLRGKEEKELSDADY